VENRPEFFFHYLALNALGVGIVPINPDYRHDEMAYQRSTRKRSWPSRSPRASAISRRSRASGHAAAVV